MVDVLGRQGREVLVTTLRIKFDAERPVSRSTRSVEREQRCFRKGDVLHVTPFTPDQFIKYPIKNTSGAL